MNNTNIETGLISDLLIEPYLFSDIESIVTVEMLQNADNINIFNAIKKLNDKSLIIDVYTLNDGILREYNDTTQNARVGALVLKLLDREYIPEAIDITTKEH